MADNRVCAENFGWVGFLVVCFQGQGIKPIPTHKEKNDVGKSGPNSTFNLVVLGLGWPWVGIPGVSVS